MTHEVLIALLDVNVLIALLDKNHLLALAVAHGIRFVTLDKRVPLATVREAREESLLVI